MGKETELFHLLVYFANAITARAEPGQNQEPDLSRGWQETQVLGPPPVASLGTLSRAGSEAGDGIRTPISSSIWD